MNSKKLLKLLTLMNKANSTRWDDVKKIVDTMSVIKVVEKKWDDNYKQNHPEWYPLDLSKIETWSTYRDCIDLVFRNENNKLVCKARIYDGDIMDGSRRNLRFTATLELPNSFIREIEYDILYVLDRDANDLYEDFLENQKKLWVSNYKSQILENL